MRCPARRVPPGTEWILSLFLATAGCGKGTSTTSKPVDEACDEDRDCVVDCNEPHDCCGPLCQCDEARSRAAANAIGAENRRYCDGRKLDCPVASCPDTGYRVVARCRARRCVTEHELRAQQVDGLWTAAGAPAPRACDADGDCLGDTAPDEHDLCCNNPYGVVPQSRAWRTWMTSWRDRSCQGHTCPPPPSPPPPRDCELAVTCVEHRCQDTCTD